MPEDFPQIYTFTVMFIFNSEAYDLWPIYTTIKSYYPIGISKSGTELFHAYPGLVKLREEIRGQVEDELNLYTNWTSFLRELTEMTGLETVGTTYGSAPCYSAYLLISSAQMDDLIRTKELHVMVSLTGPYYTVIGQDVNEILVGQGSFRNTNGLYVSPESSFSWAFWQVCSAVEKKFPGYRFVPFSICRQRLEGLDVPYADAKRDAIFHALFHDQIDIDLPRVYGDPQFKIETWKKIIT